ncbi:MAG: hypothetical protein KAU91_07695, partial [Candidatus Aminicenantes bacterium]|nr:hypothetical protein [Candidatus Aminicenantes bacterium]
MKNKRNIIIVFSLALILSFLPSCRNAVEEPAPFGPSSLSILLHTSANPNVLFAGSTREVTNITASLKKFDGTSVSNINIHFEITPNLGHFEGNLSVITKTTDSSGLVSLSYYGPTAQELANNQTLYINAYAAWEGKEIIAELTPVYIVRDKYDLDLVFKLMADPNVLWCTSERPESLITGIFTYADGTPVVGRKVFFEILSGPGEFSFGRTKRYAVTDEEGIATVTYIGPTGDEIDADQFVTIQGQPETYWVYIDPDDPNNNKYYLHKEMEIRLIKGT